MSKLEPLLGRDHSNPRMNAQGQEVFTTIDPKTGEELPPMPRAVEIPIDNHQRTLRELLEASDRPSFDGVYDSDDEDEFDDADDYDVDDPNPNPLYTEHTPHTDGFTEAMTPGFAKTVKNYVKRGILPPAAKPDASGPQRSPATQKAGDSNNPPEASGE